MGIVSGRAEDYLAPDPIAPLFALAPNQHAFFIVQKGIAAIVEQLGEQLSGLCGRGGGVPRAKRKYTDQRPVRPSVAAKKSKPIGRHPPTLARRLREIYDFSRRLANLDYGLRQPAATSAGGRAR